jgi:hypothetical protein
MGLFDIFARKPVAPVMKAKDDSPGDVDSKSDIATIPGGRTTRPTIKNAYSDMKGKTTFVGPEFVAEYIPVIRKLSWINQDVGLAINDMVQLTNTGHKIKFDPGVSADQQAKMRQHLDDRQSEWGDGLDGMSGLVNKMVSQIWVAGALSNEWVVSNDKTKVKNIALVNPETIVWSWDKKDLRFKPYQKQNYMTGEILGEKHVRLNPLTYKYLALNGDTEIPYGIPPFLTALNSLSTQGDMDQNIKFIMKQIGLMGFFEALMAKPSQNDGENEDQYRARLVKMLSDSKENLLNGIGEGLVVGYQEDHEFNFNSTTKNLAGVSDIYTMNQRSVANGLKTPPEFLGIGSGGAETGINIIFTKMLSQLQNVQKIVAANLKYGYALELRLAGFNFKNLRVEFNPSTITDELKNQQSQEIKVRNVNAKYNMGIIGQQQAADELGYDKPDQAEPRAPIDGPDQNEVDKKTKNDSAKKTREKDKAQPKRKDQKSAAAEFLVDMFLDYLGEKE